MKLIPALNIRMISVFSLCRFVQADMKAAIIVM